MRRGPSGPSRPGRRRRRASGPRTQRRRARAAVRARRSCRASRYAARRRRPATSGLVGVDDGRSRPSTPGLHRASEVLDDAGRRHRRELRLDVVGEHEQVAQLAGAVAHVVDEQRLGLEARARGTSRSAPSWSAITSTTSFASPSSTASSTAWRASAAPDAAPAALGVDDEPHLADVARPAVQRDDRDVSDDLAVLDGDRARAPGRAQAATTSGSSTSSLRNVRSASGMRAKKRSSAGSIVGLRSVGSPSPLLRCRAVRLSASMIQLGQAGHRVLDGRLGRCRT